MPGAIRPSALGNCPAHDKRMNNFVKCMVNTRAHKKGRLKYVRVCNYVKIETGRNFPPVLKIVTHTPQAA